VGLNYVVRLLPEFVWVYLKASETRPCGSRLYTPTVSMALHGIRWPLGGVGGGWPNEIPFTSFPTALDFNNTKRFQFFQEFPVRDITRRAGHCKCFPAP
jgi:hypothetical protein